MMTKNRLSVYRRSWFDRECKYDRKKRRREYHKKMRNLPINEEASCSRVYIKNATRLYWNTVTQNKCTISSVGRAADS